MVKFRVPLTLRGLGDARAREEFLAFHRLPRDLRSLLGAALEATNSTGCSVWELERLHRSLIDRRPGTAIEFGSGISTLVLAHAVRELARAGHTTRFVSMEQGRTYQDNMLGWFPADLRGMVDFRLSEVVGEEARGGMTGYRYTETPEEQFDWVFVDGPQLPRKDPLLFDADVLSLPRGHAMMVHIDGRRATVARIVEELRPVKVEAFEVHGWTTLHIDPSARVEGTS